MNVYANMIRIINDGGFCNPWTITGIMLVGFCHGANKAIHCSFSRAKELSVGWGWACDSCPDTPGGYLGQHTLLSRY
jgi:hypothetical protein